MLESFGDYAAAEGELSGDATEILLRLTQDVGLRVSPRSTLCDKQETTPPSPYLIIVLAGDPERIHPHPAPLRVPRTCPEGWQGRTWTSQEVVSSEKGHCPEFTVLSL